MARTLRIAVSVFFGLLTVALCVLWVQNYWATDVDLGRNTTIASNCGDATYS